jgi:hypothetical protein
MRKLIVPAFISLDGVVQAPGGPGGGHQRRLRPRRLDLGTQNLTTITDRPR